MAVNSGEPTAPEPNQAAFADRPLRQILKAIARSPGVLLGSAGYLLFLIATFLPWYFVSVLAPGTPFGSETTVLQFDGINGLYVHPNLQAVLGFSAPSVGFPVGLVFLFSVPFKIRKLMRSSTKKLRAATLFRSSLLTIVPAIATIALIVLLPSFIPAGAPTVVHQMAGQISSHPVAGSAPIVFPAGVPVAAQMHWGFGSALFLMIVASVLMNLGSQFERRAHRRAHQGPIIEQAQR